MTSCSRPIPSPSFAVAAQLASCIVYEQAHVIFYLWVHTINYGTVRRARVFSPSSICERTWLAVDDSAGNWRGGWNSGEYKSR